MFKTAWLETADGPAQLAIFYLPGLRGKGDELYALDHHDPFSNANVIARGIVGDLKGAPVVASPIYKQHLRLEDGQCLEDEDIKLRSWKIEFKGDEVCVGVTTLISLDKSTTPPLGQRCC